MGNKYEISELKQEINEKLAKCSSLEEETIRTHTDYLLKNAKYLYDYEYINKHEYELLCYACERHDYGKINDVMQDRMKYKGKKKFDKDNEIQHNVLSALFVHNEDFENETDFISVLYAVLYHHDNHMNNSTLSSELAYGDNDLIERFISLYSKKGARMPSYKALDIIDEMLETIEYDSIDDETKNKYIQMTKLKGLLHKCDYSSSAHQKCEYKNDFLTNGLENYIKYLSNNEKTAKWNDLQLFSLENQKNNMIIVAPTGSGKTEAGLLWAGDNKCFFVLPLKTAINAMYTRIKKQILKDEKVNEKIAVLHSDMKSFYLSKSEIESDVLFDYINKSRQLSLPIIISTMDQLFDIPFKYFGYELKLSTLSYSKVIIDEIQMYSPDLLAYMIEGIKMIIEMGGKVSVFTATLPPFAKEKLLEVMDKPVYKDFSYLGKPRHNIKVKKEKLTSCEILNFWNSDLNRESCKLLVICNSIPTAQRIFDELKNELGNDVNINLLHARFIKSDRNRKESEIIACGKTENLRYEIWISTAIVEASLDIDFDYLFTELLDIYSLFQRFGRVNRKGIKSISKVNCYVYTELQDKPLDFYLSNDDRFKFVDNKIYDLSKEAILTVEGVITEETKTELINTYLSSEKLKNTSYEQRFNYVIDTIKQRYTFEDNMKKGLRDIRNIDIIPQSVYFDNKDIIDNVEEKISDKQLDMLERIKLYDVIDKYIVSVPMHWMSENKNKRPIIVKEIRYNKYSTIPIVDCDYSSEKGLIEIYKEEKNKKGLFI